MLRHSPLSALVKAHRAASGNRTPDLLITSVSRHCHHLGALWGTDFLSIHLSSSTLLLPRSLVLAAVLVVVTGARWRWRYRIATP